MEATTHVFQKTVFYQQVFEFHRPSKFFMPDIKITGPYCPYFL
jgi:hypothetical protein